MPAEWTCGVGEKVVGNETKSLYKGEHGQSKKEAIRRYEGRKGGGNKEHRNTTGQGEKKRRVRTSKGRE